MYWEIAQKKNNEIDIKIKTSKNYKSKLNVKVKIK